MRACVHTCVRVLERTRACRAPCLRGGCARAERAWTRTFVCNAYICAYVWNRYMPVPFLLLLLSLFFFSFTGVLSPSFLSPSLSSYRSLSVYACLSFSLLKKRRVRDHSRATGRSGCAWSVRRACDKYPMSECRPTLDFDR